MRGRVCARRSDGRQNKVTPLGRSDPFVHGMRDGRSIGPPVIAGCGFRVGAPWGGITSCRDPSHRRRALGSRAAVKDIDPPSIVAHESLPKSGTVCQLTLRLLMISFNRSASSS